MALYTSCPKCEHSFAVSVDVPVVVPKKAVTNNQPSFLCFDKFLVQPTAFELRLLNIVLRDPDINRNDLAAKLGSTCTGVTSTLSRIYNKAGVKTRAGLIYFLVTAKTHGLDD